MNAHVKADMELIAVVDADPAIRSSFIALFESASYRVACFASGEEFLEAMPKLDPACVLLDLQLTDPDGRMVIAHIKEAGHAAPVILMTTNMTQRAREAASQLGIDLILDKPIEEANLFAAISNVVDEKNEASGDANLRQY